MTQQAIFGPVFAMIGLTFCVWVYMYVRRIRFIFGGGITPEQMSDPDTFTALTPPAVRNPSDNLKNLFEMPVIFYALALTLYATGRVDAVYLGAAWLFVALRVVHSAIHSTVNVVNWRFFVYMASSTVLWFIAGRALWQLAGATD